MSITWQTDWTLGLIGGLLIGLAASLFLLVNGRIMGASGIIGGLVDGSGRHNAAERVSFLLGLAIVPGLMALLWYRPDTHLTKNLALLIGAGLLVGIGTRLANGCTSGHGVCGISRLSLRGIVATVFYLVGGGVSVIVFRHILGVV